MGLQRRLSHLDVIVWHDTCFILGSSLLVEAAANPVSPPRAAKPKGEKTIPDEPAEPEQTEEEIAAAKTARIQTTTKIALNQAMNTYSKKAETEVADPAPIDPSAQPEEEDVLAAEWEVAGEVNLLLDPARAY